MKSPHVSSHLQTQQGIPLPRRLCFHSFIGSFDTAKQLIRIIEGGFMEDVWRTYMHAYMHTHKDRGIHTRMHTAKATRICSCTQAHTAHTHPPSPMIQHSRTLNTIRNILLSSPQVNTHPPKQSPREKKVILASKRRLTPGYISVFARGLISGRKISVIG